ncbi:MAG: hypothetical protein KAW45_05695 [Thermoplasmatales archaeon]|nr:hypothetical protein [Thermoplasmatales archaeon]
MKNKIFTIGLICIFLLVTMSDSIAFSMKEIINNDALNDPVYGFIVTMVKSDNGTFENQINCKMRHLINDLLREQIPVYWTTTDHNLSVKKINIYNEEDMFFEKGTYIIPFTGNKTQDIKLLAIIYDYNQSSEIEENNSLKIPVYLLKESLSIQVYPLSEVKIASYKDRCTDALLWYLEVARKCGFLNFEFLEEKMVKDNLRLTNFNVFMYQGGGAYNIFRGKAYGINGAYVDIKYNVANTIRDFVANGGGYVGSCGGAYRAACGTKHEQGLVYFPRKAYNPKLRSYFAGISISDVIVESLHLSMEGIESEIFNDTHPVTFGLDQIVPDCIFGGPKFIYIGENSQKIALYRNTSPLIDGTASWISSEFGKGDVVLFSTHPGYIAFKGDDHESHMGNTVISNAIYYSTFGDETEIPEMYSNNLSFIEEIWDITSNLKNDINQISNIFGEIKDKINDTIYNFTNLFSNIQESRDFILQIAEQKNLSLNEVKKNNFLGFIGTKDSQDHLTYFIRYLENASKTLEIIEQIYLQLENNNDFIHQVETLKTDLNGRLNESQNIYEVGFKKWEQYNKTVHNYANKKSQIIQKIMGHVVDYWGVELYTIVRMGFNYLPQAYFNSLKFLRNHWYNFETNQAV